MGSEKQPTHQMPGGQSEKLKGDEVVNDSLGTVDPADSTGTDEKKDEGGVKKGDK